MSTDISMIAFNKPFFSERERVILNQFSGNSEAFSQRKYVQKSLELLSAVYDKNLFLTANCTSALELIALCENIGKGDEFILPSFTYVSTANAFVRNGATPIFVDISPMDMNINPDLIEAAITDKTKAVVVMHYAGVACNMDAIKSICIKNHLLLVEDAAHSFGAKYKNQALGTIGDYGAISFDYTKNLHCGSGGLLIDSKNTKGNELHYLYENGTNKNDFLSGEVPYFEWVSIGSKFLLSELNAAFLAAQLEQSEGILKKRLLIWNTYFYQFKELELEEIDIPNIPDYAQHNGHVFYLKLKNKETRTQLQQWLKSNNIESSFHFIPLHSSVFGRQIGRFVGEDLFTTKESERLLRLPLHHYLTVSDIDRIVNTVAAFYRNKN